MKTNYIKPIYLIIGSLLLLIISCFFLFFATTRNQRKMQSSPKVNKIEKIKEPKKIFIIKPIADELIKQEKSVKIDSVFGFKLGDKLHEESILKELKLNNGQKIYEVSSTNSSEKFDHYYVTLEDNKIKDVRFVKNFNNKEDAKKEEQRLLNILKETYKDLKEESSYKYYKDNNGTIIMLVYKEILNKHQLKLHYFF